MRGESPEDTAMDLVIEDGSRVEAVYFLMAEDNLRKKLRLPWVSFASDSGSMAPEGAVSAVESSSARATATSRAGWGATSVTRSWFRSKKPSAV